MFIWKDICSSVRSVESHPSGSQLHSSESHKMVLPLPPLINSLGLSPARLNLSEQEQIKLPVVEGRPQFRKVSKKTGDNQKMWILLLWVFYLFIFCPFKLKTIAALVALSEKKARLKDHRGQQ